jgi:hypothetical protein
LNHRQRGINVEHPEAGVNRVIDTVLSFDMPRNPRAEVRKLFHELWTKEVGQPGYEKEKWMDLQWALQQLGVNV